jgi:hypothetical protein
MNQVAIERHPTVLPCPSRQLTAQLGVNNQVPVQFMGFSTAC